MKRTWLMLLAAVFALALFAPAAMAQDDDGYDDDDGGSASATAGATASASATAAADDDDDGAALPDTGGPALLAPIAGALLVAGALALRRNRS